MIEKYNKYTENGSNIIKKIYNKIQEINSLIQNNLLKNLN